MQYVIREKNSPVSREIFIEDKRGARLFRVHGPVIRMRDELHMEDGQGVEQALVKEPLLGDRNLYEIHREGALWAKVNSVSVGNLLEGFDLNVSGHEPLHARGNMFDREFTIHGPHGVVARVGRNGSRVEVDTASDQDDLLLLAGIVAISAMTDARVHAATQQH